MTISWYDSLVSDTVSINGTPYTIGQGIQNYVLNFNNVTEVDITGVSSNTGYFLIDNIVYNAGAPVPEPSTFILFGAGLAGVAFLKRRKNNKA